MKWLDLFVKAIGLLPVLIPVVATIQAATAEDSDGGSKFTVREAVTITLAALAKVGEALALMLPAKAAGIVRKVLAVLPVVGEIVLEIDAAASPDSPGGAKRTPVEIATIAAHGAEKLGRAIADLFKPAPRRGLTVGPLEWFVTALGGAMLVLAPLAVVWGRVRSVRVPRGPFRWPLPPVVWVYPGVDSVVVGRAMAVWTGLGHKLGPLVAVRASRSDAEPIGGIHFRPDDGTLLLLEADDGKVRAAATRLDPDAFTADIFVSREEALTVEVALHEIAHAFDYRHPVNAPTGHLMHAIADRRGMDTRGLRVE